MKNNWQKKLTISLACVTFLTATSTSYASYNLNPEVKTATTALKNATAIGVKTFENKDLQNLENKDAIVVMSFGTTYTDSRKATIEQTVADIKSAHPNTKVV